jgi:hypothetical protein
MTLTYAPAITANEHNEHAGYHSFEPFLSEPYGSFLVDFFDADQIFEQSDALETEDVPVTGWYWEAGFPGCLPDGELNGPFATSYHAFGNAQDNA